MKIRVILFAISHSKSASLHHLVEALLPGSPKAGGVKMQTVLNMNENIELCVMRERGIFRCMASIAEKMKVTYSEFE